MQVIPNNNILKIIRTVSEHIDIRLFYHGEKVAYIVYKMLEAQGACCEKLRDCCMLALLHDIGAYKTDEIDKMIIFETTHFMSHSVYSYAFLESMFGENGYCDSILYHHINYNKLYKTSCKNVDLSDKIHLADRMEVISSTKNEDEMIEYINNLKGISFSKENVELFIEVNKNYNLIKSLKDESAVLKITEIIDKFSFTKKELQRYTHLVVMFIDFRSFHTVTHTILVSAISQEIGSILKLPTKQKEKLKIASLFHDIGKLCIPISIIEKKGKLTDEEMIIMRNHAQYSEDILTGILDDEIVQISVRHHERMDGRGYPKKLSGNDLTTEQRIMAVSDILSALIGKRSYKEGFSKEQTIIILKSMVENGAICCVVAHCVIENYDRIILDATIKSQFQLQLYASIIPKYDTTTIRFNNELKSI